MTHKMDFAQKLVLFLVAFFCLSTHSLLAYEYRVPILVEDETDLEELYYSQDITLDERDRLLEMLESPLDINSATRDELYNLPGLSYSDVDRIIDYRKNTPFKSKTDIKKVSGITTETYAQLRPFIQVVKIDVPTKKVPWSGQVRIQAVDQANDDDGDYPEGYVRVRIKRGRTLEFGALLLTENTVQAPKFVNVPDTLPETLEWKFDKYGDPKVNPDGISPAQEDSHRRYLRTDGETYLPTLPKIYAMVQLDHIGWGTAKVKMLAGSYRIGFGQRIVFDNSGRRNPYSFQPDLVTYQNEDSITPFRGLFGAAATLSDISLSRTISMDGTAFFSWWQYDIYQPDLRHGNSDELVQMGEDGDEGYTLLTPYKEYPPGSGQTYYKRISYQTLPRAYNELLGGGNLTFRFGPRIQWGLTAYASNITFNLDDDGTQFSRASKFPNRDTFWAVGTDAAWQLDWFNLFAEVGMMDNQAPAGVIHAVADIDELRLEASYRYYSDDFDNPHSRAYAMSDELDGDRDKGEQGFMFTARYRPVRMLTLRVDQDLWRQTMWTDTDTLEDKDHAWRSETYLRVDVTPLNWFRVGAFVQYNDKDLSSSGRDLAYAEDGEKVQFGLQAAFLLPKNSRIWAYYKMPMYDAALGDSFQKDHYGTIKFTTRPIHFLRLSGRAKYFKGELEQLQGASREHYYEGYLETGFYITKDLVVSARGLVRDFVDSEIPYEVFWRAGAEWKF